MSHIILFFPFTISYMTFHHNPFLWDRLSRNFRRVRGARITFHGSRVPSITVAMTWKNVVSLSSPALPQVFMFPFSYTSSSTIWPFCLLYQKSSCPDQYVFYYQKLLLYVSWESLEYPAFSAHLLLQPLCTHLQMGLCEALPTFNYSTTLCWMPWCWNEHLLLISESMGLKIYLYILTWLIYGPNPLISIEIKPSGHSFSIVSKHTSIYTLEFSKS